MHRDDLVRCLHDVGVEVDEKLVSAETLNLPASARMRELANFDGNQLAFQQAFRDALKEGRILGADSYRRALAFGSDYDFGDLMDSLPQVSAADYDEATFRALVDEDIRTLESLFKAVENV